MDAGRVRMLTLFATALGSALAFLDTTVVIVALPRMEEDLGLGLTGQQWVYLSYSLSLSAFYLIGGAIGDRVGLRRTFVVGVVLFALASLLTALAPSEGVLIAGRTLQGVGGAVLTTTSLALLRVTWAGEAGRAIGLWTSLTSLATIGGPPLGGVIVETVSWRWVFAINVPLAALTVGLAVAGRGEDERVRGRSTLDLVGSALVAVALTGISFAIVEVRERGLDAVLPFLVAGLAALAGLVVWTLRARDPVVPPSLLRVPGLAAANLVTLVMYAALGAHLLFLPVYLQFLGFSPTLAGLVFVPSEHRPDPARAPVRPLRRPERASRPDRVRRRHDRHRRAPSRARDDPGRGLDVGPRERLPLRGRPACGRRADHGGRAVTCSRGPRGRRLGTEPDRGAGGRHPLGRRDRRAGRDRVRRPRRNRRHAVRPSAAGAVRDAGIDAFHAVVLCIASLAFLASVLAAVFLRGQAQRRTPSSVRSATLRSNPPA